MEDRNDEETVAVIRYTGQTDIPREERCQQREQPTSLDDGLVGLRRAVAVDVADSEEQEGDVDCDEDTGEDEGGFQRADDEEECKYEPALILLAYTYVYIRGGERGRIPIGINQGNHKTYPEYHRPFLRESTWSWNHRE